MSDDDKLITKHGRTVDRDLWDVALVLVGGNRHQALPIVNALQDERERWASHIDSFEMEDRIIEERGAKAERERIIGLLCIAHAKRHDCSIELGPTEFETLLGRIRSGEQP